MSEPIGEPIAQPQLIETGRSERDSAPFSPPNHSASRRSNYLTRYRLEALGRRMAADDWSVLDFVSAARLATGGQLVRRFWLAGDRTGSDARPGRRTLKRLRQWRVLDVLPRRVGGTRGGSDGLVYLLGVAGAKLLADRGVTPKRPDAPGARYVDHTLAICELVVGLSEAAGGGRLDLLAVETEPVCWRTFLGPLAARLTLKPDLFVRIGAGA